MWQEGVIVMRVMREKSLDFRLQTLDFIFALCGLLVENKRGAF